MKIWKNENLEKWKFEKRVIQKKGYLEIWKFGKIEIWKNGNQD